MRWSALAVESVHRYALWEPLKRGGDDRMLLKNPFNIIICGVGGQGNVKMSRILGMMLVREFFVTIGETFGASQRGGSVMSHIRVSTDSLWSPQIPPGRADLILALEPLEGLRVIQQYASAESQAIINIHPIYPIHVIRGDCVYPSLDEIKTHISARIGKSWFLDATTLSLKEFNNSIYHNSILLGAMAGLDLIPMDSTTFGQAASHIFPPHTLMENERAFKMGISLIMR